MKVVKELIPKFEGVKKVCVVDEISTNSLEYMVHNVLYADLTQDFEICLKKRFLYTFNQ